MSMDDDDLDAGIGEIEGKLEEIGDDSQAQSKLERSKKLLLIRKEFIQLKNDMLTNEYQAIKSNTAAPGSHDKFDPKLKPQAESIKKELT